MVLIYFQCNLYSLRIDEFNRPLTEGSFVCILLFSPSVTSQPTTTITVGSGPPVDITATPTINQSVELQCSRTGAPKQWYSTGSRVKATPGEVWTTGGHTRKLGFSTFATSHAGTYSCRVRNNNEEIKTTYTVVLGKSVKLIAEHSCPIVYMCRVMIHLTAIVTTIYMFETIK